MGLFDKYHDQITAYLSRRQAEGKVAVHQHNGVCNWPVDRKRNLVMAQDTAVELGSPRDASTSFLFWVDEPGRLKNGRIRVVGPDIPDAAGTSLPFGKLVIVGGEGFNAENSYDRYREMELLRYDLHLKGYMMRAVSQYGREWSRISREAFDSGFSFSVLGGAMIDQFSRIDYIRSVEILFVTSPREDVLELEQTAEGVGAIIGAMNKMAGEMSFDCDTCEYIEVCGDVAELRSMRKTLEERGAAHAG